MSEESSKALANEIRSKITLSKLISEKVELRQAGTELKGLCPFHEEQTPSFVVNDKKGFYHCFGCGAHGDAIQWVKKQENVTYAKAISKLAKIAGVVVDNKKGGGKLNRSETVTVRFDPKLNYLSELASRAQRRTKSSFIEWAVAEALASVALPEVVSYDSPLSEPREANLKEKVSQLWHVDEADRVVALALTAPALLTHDEQLIWRMVRENGYLWKGRYDSHDEWSWDLNEESLVRDRLRSNWETFKAVAAGEESEDALPKWAQHRTRDLDEEVPF